MAKTTSQLIEEIQERKKAFFKALEDMSTGDTVYKIVDEEPGAIWVGKFVNEKQEGRAMDAHDFMHLYFQNQPKKFLNEGG